MTGNSDDPFEPYLGPLKDTGKASGKSFTKQVLSAAQKYNPRFSHSHSKRGFTGRNIGRGYQVLTQSLYPPHLRRRVIIKARIIKLAGEGFRKARVHVRYLQRDGVSKEDATGTLYNDKAQDIDGEAFTERCRNDRHQFRFIVSPEDAHQLTDNKAFIRDLMHQAETDWRTKLDWIAVDHYNTANPHTHIIIRGVDDKGGDLIIARDYLSDAFRERASEIISAELGPRQQYEIEIAMRREVTRDRFTSLDSSLIKRAEDGVVDMRGGSASEYGLFKHRLSLARLQKLRNMGLAEEIDTGRWHLSDELEPTLRALGSRGDIIKMMHAEMAHRDRNPPGTGYEIYRSGDSPKRTIIGRLVRKGLADEINDHYYLVIDSTDGKTRYVDIGRHKDIEELKLDTIIEVTPKPVTPSKTDRTIAEIAKHHNGLYDDIRHAQHDPKASAAFIETHIRRLEALRRARLVKRFSDGSWEIPGDYLDQVETYLKGQARQSPISIISHSTLSLEAQVTAMGATWLDRQLLTPGRTVIGPTGFGAEVETALKRRQAFLIEEGFATQTEQGISYRKDMLKALERREIQQVAGSLAQQLGKRFQPVTKGHRVEGVYTHPIDLASGRFALIEKSKEFSLVPWRAVLERARGKSVSGTLSGAGISWDIGKRNGGLGIS